MSEQPTRFHVRNVVTGEEFLLPAKPSLHPNSDYVLVEQGDASVNDELGTDDAGAPPADTAPSDETTTSGTDDGANPPEPAG